MDNRKRKLANKGASSTKKSNNAGNKIQIKHSQRYKSNSRCENLDIATLVRLCTSELLRGGKLVVTNEERGCDKQDEGVPEEMLNAGKTLHNKVTVRYTS